MYDLLIQCIYLIAYLINYEIDVIINYMRLIICDYM